MARVDRNPLLLCIYHTLFGAIFPVAIFPLFWVNDLHMSVTTMLSVQALFGFVVALFEFPSGYVADRLGHRTAVIAGSAIVLLGWALYALAHSLLGVILAESVLGVGFSLISGADSALLYESLLLRGQELTFARWYGRMRVCGQLAEGSASLLAGLLYVRSARLPFQAEVCVWVLALGVAMALAKVPSAAPKVEHHLQQMRYIGRHVLRENKPLRAVMFAGVAFSLMSFLPIWLMALYARDAGMPTAWVGPFWAAANFIVALGSLLSDRLGARFGLVSTLAGCIAVAALAYAGLGLSHTLYGAFCYFGLMLARGIQAPLLHHEEQRLVPSSDRAGFLSFRNFLFRGSYVLLGPAIGWAVERYGQHPVLLGCGVFVVLTLIGTTRDLSARIGRANTTVAT